MFTETVGRANSVIEGQDPFADEFITEPAVPAFKPVVKVVCQMPVFPGLNAVRGMESTVSAKG